MPLGSSVMRRPAAGLGRMPTAVFDWRQKSDRATRWKNRFAMWVRNPGIRPDPASLAVNFDKMRIVGEIGDNL